MSYNGIGLPSAKGSSTSGYVQQSLAFKDNTRKANFTKAEFDKKVVEQDQSIKSHKARREVELLVSEYRDRLEDAAEDDETLTDDLIDKKCEEYRNSLLRKNQNEIGNNYSN